MAAPPRVAILGCPVDLVDMETAVEIVVGLVESNRASPGGAAARKGGRDRGLVATLNPEMVMTARRDPSFLDLLRQAALIIPDGVGVVRALRRRGYGSVGRVAGVDLLDVYFPRAAARRHRIALAGAAPGVAVEASRRLVQRFPGLRIVTADCGGPSKETAARLAKWRPDVVCAAYGAGPQERFLHQHLDAMGASVGIGVGGTLDFIAGASRRAPAWLREAGLEWAWRLAWEPWRARRQLVLPAFWWHERKEAARGGG